MKRALIDSNNNKVLQVVDSVDDEFEVHNALYWVDCPNDAASYYDYDPDNLTFTDPHALSKDAFGNPVEPFVMQRMRAYPSGGDQMDMLWKEIQATGTISVDGEWFQSILAVKQGIPKPDGYDPANPIPSTSEQMIDGAGNIVKIYSGENGTTDSDGIGAEFKIRVSSDATQLAVMALGSGYAVGDTFTFTKSSEYNFTATVISVDADGGITNIAIDA